MAQSVNKLKPKRDWLLKQDNDTKHTTKSTRNYIKKHKLKILEFPSQSPELNIFENMWVDIKHVVHMRWPKNTPKLEPFCKEVSVKIH